MDFKQIKELIELVNNTELSEVTIEKEDYRIVVKNKKQAITQMPIAMPQMMPAMPQAAAAPVQQAEAPKQEAAKPAADDTSNLITIKSPMIGTFYRSPSPDKPPHVKVGDTIEVGSPLCLVEAMKLFNEIESEVAGRIVKVLIDDASPVEYDQPLFLVEPA